MNLHTKCNISLFGCKLPNNDITSFDIEVNNMLVFGTTKTS